MRDESTDADTLYGEIEQTIATLRGEADELRNPDRVAFEDIAGQLDHRADALESAFEDFTTRQDRHDEGDELDPYLELVRAIRPGLLLTVNDSPHVRGATDELEVVNVDRQAPRLDLKGHDGQHYRMYEHPERDLIIEEIDNEGRGGWEAEVVTIQVIGIA